MKIKAQDQSPGPIPGPLTPIPKVEKVAVQATLPVACQAKASFSSLAIPPNQSAAFWFYNLLIASKAGESVELSKLKKLAFDWTGTKLKNKMQACVRQIAPGAECIFPVLSKVKCEDDVTSGEYCWSRNIT